MQLAVVHGLAILICLVAPLLLAKVRIEIVSLIRLSFGFLNLPRRESGCRGVVSLLPTVPTPFYVGVPVKRQQPIDFSIEMLH